MPTLVLRYPSLFHLQYYTSELLFIGDLFMLQLEQQQPHRTVHVLLCLPLLSFVQQQLFCSVQFYGSLCSKLSLTKTFWPHLNKFKWLCINQCERKKLTKQGVVGRGRECFQQPPPFEKTSSPTNRTPDWWGFVIIIDKCLKFF